jgi:hypothetical protein
MTIRVYNGQTTKNEQLVWRERNGVRVLEPESGWVNSQTICDYYKQLTPKDRRSLIARLAEVEIEKTQQELEDEQAYDQARADYLANRPLT